MSEISRRRFLGSSAALPFGLGLGATAAAQEGSLSGATTMIVTGANVITMDYNKPSAEAVAIRGAQILAVGSNDEILHFLNLFS